MKPKYIVFVLMILILLVSTFLYLFRDDLFVSTENQLPENKPTNETKKLATLSEDDYVSKGLIAFDPSGNKVAYVIAGDSELLEENLLVNNEIIDKSSYGIGSLSFDKNGQLLYAKGEQIKEKIGAANRTQIINNSTTIGTCENAVEVHFSKDRKHYACKNLQECMVCLQKNCASCIDKNCKICSTIDECTQCYDEHYQACLIDDNPRQCVINNCEVCLDAQNIGPNDCENCVINSCKDCGQKNCDGCFADGCEGDSCLTDSYYITIDGKKRSSFYTSIIEASFSEDNNNFTYFATKEGNSYFVNNEGEYKIPLEKGEQTDGCVVSSDGIHYACKVKKGDLTYVIHDGEKQKNTYDSIYHPDLILSPNGKRIAFRASRNGYHYMVIDGIEKEYVSTGFPSFSPDSLQVGYSAAIGTVTNRTKTSLNYTDAKHFIVVNDKIISEYYAYQASNPIFSPDGKHIVFTAGDRDEADYSRQKYFIVLDGNEGKHYDQILGSLMFSKDSQHIAYLAIDNKKGRLAVLDDQEYDASNISKMYLSPDGKYIAYIGTTDDGKTFMGVNDKKGRIVDEIYTDPIFDSTNIMYGARMGNELWWINDNIESLNKDFPELSEEELKNKESKELGEIESLFNNSETYKNQKYGFEIKNFTGRDPSHHDWSADRHTNMPERLFDDYFFDDSKYKYGYNLEQRTGVAAMLITVNECQKNQNIEQCLSMVTSPCGTVPYGEIVSSYKGTGVFNIDPSFNTFKNLVARKIKFKCSGQDEQEGLIVLKGNRLYTVTFLTSSINFKPMPKQLVELVMNSFALTSN